MKKNVLFLLLLLGVMSNAQIVNIPDENLKNVLVNSGSGDYSSVAEDENSVNLAVDANNDGEVQISEALEVWDLNLHDFGIESLEGLEAFTNLRILWVRDNYLESIDFTPFINLEEINCRNPSDGGEVLASIDLSGLVNLKSLICSNNQLTSLDLSGLGNLEYLGCNNNELLSLDLQDQINLKALDCSENPITSLDLTGLVNLTDLVVAGTSLTTLQFADCTNLINFDCRGGIIETLDISSLLLLEKAIFRYNDELTSVTIGNLPNLTEVDCTHTSIVEIDLSGCPVLSDFAAASADELRFVNLKNGPQVVSLDGLFSIEDEIQYFVCIDEGEEQFLPAYVINNPQVIINSYCSFTPGGDYNTIAGTFYFDGDNNGCGLGDEVQGFASINITDGTNSGTNYSNDGAYGFYVETGDFTVTPTFMNSWFTVTPASATINLTTVNNSMNTQDFCLAANGVHPDLEVVIVPISGANPGFDTSYNIVYKNKGNQTLSGDVVFTYDDAVLDFISANPVNTTAGTGSLTWNYTNLHPFMEEVIGIEMNLNGPMDTPAINNGDYLDLAVAITPDSGDETPVDNTFTLNQLVEGSFDPNDISCLEGETVHPDMIGEYLHYNINFENTGDAAATFIVVKDIINEAQFDVSSLQMLYASHDVEVRVEDNKVEFFFDAIDLGPLEKGNVTFKIKTLNTLQVDDNVMQQADIFFDYNWPIQTNEANTMFAILNSGGFELDNTVKVYPNPSINVVNIEAATEVKSVQLYDVAGRLLQTVLVNDMHASIDIASRASGIYFVKITTEEGGKVEKLIKQ